jgi:hypothetical protein
MKVLGNAEHAFHLDLGAGIGNPADRAIDGGLTVIGDDLASQERPAARHGFLFGHGNVSKCAPRPIMQSDALNGLHQDSPVALPRRLVLPLALTSG